MTSTSGSAITPRDFNSNTKDPQRDEWSPGAMQHLVNALKDAQVAIVCDKQTGFAEVGVTLGGVRVNGYGHHEVLVRRTYSDGTSGGCWYLLFQVGAVMVLDRESEGLGARYEAYRSYSQEQTRAIAKLRKEMGAELGIEDFPRGTWEARSFPGRVHASFRPEKILDPVRFTWRSYTSKELADAE